MQEKSLNQLWSEKDTSTILGLKATWRELHDLLDEGATVHDEEVYLLMRRMSEKLDRAIPEESVPDALQADYEHLAIAARSLVKSTAEGFGHLHPGAGENCGICKARKEVMNILTTVKMSFEDDLLIEGAQADELREFLARLEFLYDTSHLKTVRDQARVFLEILKRNA